METIIDKDIALGKAKKTKIPKDIAYAKRLKNEIGSLVEKTKRNFLYCTKSHDVGNTIWCRLFTARWVTNIILLYFLSCVVSGHK